MDSQKNYKILSYTALSVVIIFSFFFSNFILNLIINDKAPGSSIIYLIIFLVLNFGMFFIVFRLIQLLLERDSTINELNKYLSIFREDKTNETISEEKAERNIDELLEQSIPASPQTLGLQKFCEKILANIAKVTEMSQGILYLKDKESGQFRSIAKFAYYSHTDPVPFIEGENLPGQVAKDKKILNIVNVPDDFVVVASGLGQAKPTSLILVPVIEKEETIALFELASFKPFSKDDEVFLEKLSVLIGKIVLKIK